MCTTAEILKTKFGVLPEGFEVQVASAAGDYIGECVGISRDWCITISGVYGDTTWHEMYYLQERQAAFVSAVRDKLMTSHWRRMARLANCQKKISSMAELMRPFSSMEALNHVPA